MLRQFRNRRRYEKAASDLEPGETLCATLVDDKPVYFAMSVEATDEEVRQRAFEIREGREMSTTERTMLRIAEKAKG